MNKKIKIQLRQAGFIEQLECFVQVGSRLSDIHIGQIELVERFDIRVQSHARYERVFVILVGEDLLPLGREQEIDESLGSRQVVRALKDRYCSGI